MFGDGLITPWFDAMRAQAPGLELFDVHTHIGANDPDGFTCSPQELEEALAAVASRAAVFPMHEPGGYAKANDAVVAAAEASGGRLVPFLRLDPSSDPLTETRRALDAGARGIKLHPRAEQFALDASSLAPVLELAAERGLPVLVHAGRGIPALGRDAVAICERHPQIKLILAHAGISDLAWIWRRTADLPNLFFDTSWWSAADLLTLYCHVPPRHILFASDAPYTSPGFAAVMNLRCALQAGLSPDALRSVFGAQAARLVAGEDALDAGPAAGTKGLTNDPLLARVGTFLSAAIGQAFGGVDPAEQLSLARLACEVGDDAPQAPACATIAHLLKLREHHLASGADDGRPEHFAPGSMFIVLAAIFAATPDVAQPPLADRHY